MHKVLVVGAGKIGSLIACLLEESDNYIVHIADLDFSKTDATRVLQATPSIQRVVLNVRDEGVLCDYLRQHEFVAVISCLPYFLNVAVATAAKQARVNYFDLTEDTTVTAAIKKLAQHSEVAFVPQCGLAPGIVTIIANDLIQTFDVCRAAKLRVGALPQRANNGLHYSLTWSTDGLINEYGNVCHAIEQGQFVAVPPLEGLEDISLEGQVYEAFNTSGGLGSLADLYLKKIDTLNYKTIRYKGHCEKMRFLLMDLQLNTDRPMLKAILERALPKTYQDMVIIYVAVEGFKNGELIETSYVKKIYPSIIHDLQWSAIQISTASGVCAVVDLVLAAPQKFHGLVLQETFRLVDITTNQFGRCYASV